MTWARRAMSPLLNNVMRVPLVAIAVAVVSVAMSLLLASRMGSEFAPNLNEGDFAVQALRVPGTSLTQSLEMQMQLESTLKEKFPEIERVFARTGTAEIATTTMPPNISDGYIMLKPKEQWPDPKSSRDDLLAAMQRLLKRFPAATTSSRNPSNCGSTNSSPAFAAMWQ